MDKHQLSTILKRALHQPTAMLLSIVAAASLILLSTGCDSSGPGSEHAEITLLVASSTRSAIEEIVHVYKQDNRRVNFRISSGASNGLAQQILAGAPADIFLSANVKWVEELKQADLIDMQVHLLTNRLVMVVPTGNPAGIESPVDLLSAQVQRIAVAGQYVPAGIYAEQTLISLALFEKLKQGDKLVRGSDVRIALAYVERGEVDAGIVYATDAQISTQVKSVWEFDEQLHDPIVYPAVLLRQKKPSIHAKDFFEFLTSIEANRIFQKYGFKSID